MSYRKLTANGCDQVSEIITMLNVAQERAILFINRLPIGSVHFGVVKVFSLDAPGLAEDLRPLGARIHQHFHLGDVDRTVSYFRGPIDWNYAPPIASARGLVQKFFLIF